MPTPPVFSYVTDVHSNCWVGKRISEMIAWTEDALIRMACLIAACWSGNSSHSSVHVRLDHQCGGIIVLLPTGDLKNVEEICLYHDLRLDTYKPGLCLSALQRMHGIEWSRYRDSDPYFLLWLRDCASARCSNTCTQKGIQEGFWHYLWYSGWWGSVASRNIIFQYSKLQARMVRVCRCRRLGSVVSLVVFRVRGCCEFGGVTTSVMLRAWPPGRSGCCWAAGIELPWHVVSAGCRVHPRCRCRQARVSERVVAVARWISLVAYKCSNW